MSPWNTVHVIIKQTHLHVYNFSQILHGLILGLVGQLKQDTFNILDKVQQRMANCIKSVGNIEHEVYPQFLTQYT